MQTPQSSDAATTLAAIKGGVNVHQGQVSTTRRAPDAQRLVELYVCPISKELLVDPVVAGDGHTYERACIQQWLKTSTKSPKTNLPLPTTALTTCELTRQAIAALIEADVVDDEMAATWLFASGKLKIEDGTSSSESIAKQHFEEAKRLGSDAATLALEMLSLKRRADEAGLSEALLVFPDAKRHRQENPSRSEMPHWEHLAPGTTVRVMDGARQLRECVERYNRHCRQSMSPDGGYDQLNFMPRMESFAGRTCSVLAADSFDKTFKLRLEDEHSSHEDTSDYWFPYTAVSVLQRADPIRRHWRQIRAHCPWRHSHLHRMRPPPANHES